MKWAVELLQGNFDNVPLALDTSNVAAIEAGISVYNRSKGKPIVNSADAAGRIGYVDVAAANDAIVIALCNGEGIAKDNDERMMYMQTLMERGMEQVWTLRTICGSTRYSSLSKECRTNRWKFLNSSK